jgi:hypothetical protein
MYRFIRDHAERFDGYRSADDRRAAAEGGAIVRLRTRPDAPTVVHVVNTDYRWPTGRRRDAVPPAENVAVRIPAHLAPGAKRARLLRYDAEPQSVDVEAAGDVLRWSIPALGVWTVAVLEA